MNKKNINCQVGFILIKFCENNYQYGIKGNIWIIHFEMILAPTCIYYKKIISRDMVKSNISTFFKLA